MFNTLESLFTVGYVTVTPPTLTAQIHKSSASSVFYALQWHFLSVSRFIEKSCVTQFDQHLNLPCNDQIFSPSSFDVNTHLDHLSDCLSVYLGATINS